MLILVSGCFAFVEPSPESSTGQPLQSAEDPLIGKAVALLGLSITWSSFVVQVFVVPFYDKGETLHKDYWGSGKINSAIAALEAGVLIPTLAKMFNLAADNQTDKRRRIKEEMEDLLQSVKFIPHLKSAQNAMSQMESIRQHYDELKHLSLKLWKSGLFHAVVTVCWPAVYLFAIPFDARFQWLFWIFAAFWVFSLFSIARRYFRFHDCIQSFNASLEIDVTEDM